MLAFYFDHAPAPGSAVWYIFLTFMIAAGICYSIALFWLVGAALFYHYERLAHAQTLYDYYGELQNYYKEHPEAEGTPRDRFDEFIQEKMVKATCPYQ